MNRFVTSMKASVIVPVRNDGKNLDACLASIAISMDEFDKIPDCNSEAVIVNNNSTDGTQAVIEKYVSNDSRFRSAFERKVGRGAARHAGEAVARGEIILCTDSDCVVPRNWIDDMTLPIREGRAVAVQGYEKAADAEGESNGVQNYWSAQQQARFEERWRAAISDTNASTESGFVDTKNFSIKSDVLRSIGGTDARLKALIDTELHLRLKRVKDAKIEFVKSAPVEHRHPTSLFRIFAKNVVRGYWASELVRMHKRDISKAEKSALCMTFKSYFYFFPGLITLPFKRGVKYALFNEIAGKAWRTGIFLGIVTRIFK